MTTINAVGVGLSTASGTGEFVGTVSPTLVTPVLGTPSSGNLVNCTGYPATGLVGLTAGQIIVGTSASAPAATTISSGTGITVTSGSGSISIALSGSSGIGSWISASSTPITAAVNTGYYITDASTVTITLPATAAAGSVVAIAGNGAGGWILAPGSGQTIKVISASASTSVASAEQYDCIEVVCTVANTTWVARSAMTSGFTYS